MVVPFTYTTQPVRVVFRAARLAELGAKLDRLAVSRAMLLCTPEQVPLAGRVGPRSGTLCARAAMHRPVELTMDALAQLHARGCDGLVSLGGGSAIGCGANPRPSDEQALRHMLHRAWAGGAPALD